MLDYDVQSTEDRVYGYLPAYINYGLATAPQVWRRRMFTHGGFGPCDPRKKKQINSGWFTKESWNQLTGTMSSSVGPIWYDFLEVNNNNGLPLQHIVSNQIDSAAFTKYLVDDTGDDVSNRVYNECLSKAYDKLRSSEVNLAVSIGEGTETARMFKQFLVTLGWLGKSARSLRRQIVRNPSMVVSSGWLMYKYGWESFVRDVYGYVSYQHETRKTIDVSARRTVKQPITRAYRDASGYTDYVRGEKSTRCEIKFTATVSSESAHDLSRLTSLNPATIAWELTPLSFVVDWFVDIGSYLQNLETSWGMGLQFNGGYKTITSRYSGEWTRLGEKKENFLFQGAIPSTRTVRWNGKAWRQISTKERFVLNSFPSPTLPSFKVGLQLGSQRLASAAALVRTVLLGRVK